MTAKQLQFVILGSGINGLSCAIRLSEEFPNSKIQIISEQFSPNTTSDVAAGLWGPYILGGTPDAKCRFVIQNKKVQIEDFISIFVVSEDGRMNHTTISCNYGELDLPIACGKLNLSQITNFQGSYSVAFMYATFTCEPSKMMNYYYDILSARNVQFLQKRIQSINCLEMLNISSNAIIVNCLGFNSKYVFNDCELFPVRGQVQKVKANFVFHSIACESCYIIPNTDTVVLGGTKQKSNNLNVNFVDRYNIRNNCHDTLPALKEAIMVTDNVGLRPVRRSGVRLELENITSANGRNYAVIHNYGHGGAGITLAWGCAGTVVQLVQRYAAKGSKL
uniref:FAD dependent oxidoreductase domain-containing protein n=1 Tax=Anopheles epiroticus TaxID=199890 RepID=A0A182PR36_9DIPT